MIIELITYFIYIYLIIYYFAFKITLNFCSILIIYFIIFIGSIFMFPLWGCKNKYLDKYKFIYLTLHSAYCCFILYILNKYNTIIIKNPIYFFLVSISPLFYFIYIKFLQNIWKCNKDPLFFKNAAKLYFILIINTIFLIINSESINKLIKNLGDTPYPRH